MTLTGGRLAAALLMMLATVGAMITYLDDARFFREDWPLPVVAAALIGLAVGWAQLGPSLGRDFPSSGLFGLGAAFVAVVGFAVAYALRSAWITHMGVQFQEPFDAVVHVVKAAFAVLESAVVSRRTLAALVVGSVSAGILAEFCARVWK